MNWKCNALLFFAWQSLHSSAVALLRHTNFATGYPFYNIQSKMYINWSWAHTHIKLFARCGYALELDRSLYKPRFKVTKMPIKILRFVGMTLVWWSNWTHGSKHDARITSYVEYISKKIAFRIALLSTYEISWCYRSIMPIPAKVSRFRQRQSSQCKLNQIRPFLVCFCLVPHAIQMEPVNRNPWDS